ncbi:YdcF family protein [Lysinibacillus piscis]|uniref:DUF218 domain-containing protein n=1 Tax=Lysinibacillus piscis TaxID=2518931 RepID=A0ABQ5NMA7_9BACI|nr:YdcF family protein [Lysinibacillus sp. KH24]GLC89485.1 hypothetical protein LYSBPC_26120 [Lysinibacillus sp. KH24]
MRKWLIRASILAVGISGAFYIWLGQDIKKGVEPVADGTATYMIVLGAKVKPGGVPSLSLKNRLEVAAQYLQQHPHVNVIVSGGQGADEEQTEASVMLSYLQNKGIERQRIIVEDQSTSTYENLLFSKKLLPEGTTHITIVSNDFHLRRARYLADVLDLKADVLVAATPKSVEAKSQLRERAALLKTYIIGH